MDALLSWRETALRERADQLPLRPTSPVSEGEESDDVPPTPPREMREGYPSASETPKQPVARPTSLFWVQWWSRNKRASRGTREMDLEKGRKSSMEDSSTVGFPSLEDYYNPLICDLGYHSFFPRGEAGPGGDPGSTGSRLCSGGCSTCQNHDICTDTGSSGAPSTTSTCKNVALDF